MLFTLSIYTSYFGMYQYLLFLRSSASCLSVIVDINPDNFNIIVDINPNNFNNHPHCMCVHGFPGKMDLPGNAQSMHTWEAPSFFQVEAEVSICTCLVRFH